MLSEHNSDRYCQFRFAKRTIEKKGDKSFELPVYSYQQSQYKTASCKKQVAIGMTDARELLELQLESCTS